jgi:DNA polymerase-3 subunit gamma/tau
MLNAISLYHFRWRKKKVKSSFIIPATHFRNSSYSITEVKPTVETPKIEASTATQTLVKEEVNSESIEEKPQVHLPKVEINQGQKVSVFSLASIKAKKEIEAQQKNQYKHHDELPREKFSETDMLLVWNKFAQKLSNQGKKLMATYMQMNDPILKDTSIILELPNESTKEEFLMGANDLVGYLRGKLHNHDITIDVIVNEVTENRYAFTPEEKYNKLKEINPNLELLKKLFDLDV